MGHSRRECIADLSGGRAEVIIPFYQVKVNVLCEGNGGSRSGGLAFLKERRATCTEDACAANPEED